MIGVDVKDKLRLLLALCCEFDIEAPSGEIEVSLEVVDLDRCGSFEIFIKGGRFLLDTLNPGAVDGGDLAIVTPDADQISRFADNCPLDCLSIDQMENVSMTAIRGQAE